MSRHYYLTSLAARSILLLNTLTRAHMRMIQPIPLNGDTDANKNPLGPGNPYPCQGYIGSHAYSSAQSYIAGNNVTITLEGTARHGGGSCQISLSYDKGQSFRVVESIIGGCPLSEEIAFNVPNTAPAGAALLAWTWFNKIGNREMYMNCAWVQIKASPVAAKQSGHRHMDAVRLDSHGNPAHFPSRHHIRRRHTHHQHLHSRRSSKTFNDLPLIFKANIPQSDYATSDGCDVHFPHPGPVVKHGTSLDSWCDNPHTGYTRKADAFNGQKGVAAISSSSTDFATMIPPPFTVSLNNVTAASSGFSMPTVSSNAPFYPNTTTTYFSTMSQPTTSTQYPSSSTSSKSIATSSSTTPAQTQATPTPAAPPRQPGQSDSCTIFGSWRCDQGGQRLNRCNYASDWVTSHQYTWADMGVPSGTRCVLDGAGEPTFVYDT